MTQSTENGKRTPGARAALIATLVAVACIVTPFMFWKQTWFGEPLDAGTIAEYLADEENPRKAQHVLAQLSERIAAGDESVKQWYPAIIGLSRRDLPQLRLTAAWVMGEDNKSEEFQRALLDLLDDPEAMVRRNAALSLIRFGDEAGKPVLVNMLRSFPVAAPQAGVVAYRLKPGDTVDRETMLARIEIDGRDELLEIRSPLPGIVETRLREDGDPIRAGETIVVVGPDPAHVFEALRALYLVGGEEELELVASFTRPREGMPRRVAEQARLTADRIRGR